MAAAEIPRLAAELETYTSHKSEWLAGHPGEHVVIKGNAVLGFFPTFEAAYRAGTTTYGIDTDFLVKRIVQNEPVFCIF